MGFPAGDALIAPEAQEKPLLGPCFTWLSKAACGEVLGCICAKSIMHPPAPQPAYGLAMTCWDMAW